MEDSKQDRDALGPPQGSRHRLFLMSEVPLHQEA